MKGSIKTLIAICPECNKSFIAGKGHNYKKILFCPNYQTWLQKKGK